MIVRDSRVKSLFPIVRVIVALEDNPSEPRIEAIFIIGS